MKIWQNELLTLKTLEKAEVFFHKGEPDKGIETILQEGIKLIPAEERFYFFLTEKLIEEKRYQDALGVLSELPSDKQDKRKSLLNAYAHEGLGDTSTAGELLKGLLADPAVTLHQPAIFVGSWLTRKEIE